MQSVKELKANPENPRTISKSKLAMLKNSLLEFGDLGCVVFNRTTKLLVGGHQRVRSIPPDSEIVIEKLYKKPTRTGTIAEGYIEIEDERFKYREVIWDETKEKAANLAANKGAGEWDLSKVGEWLKEIEEMDFDLDLTMFDAEERAGILGEEIKEQEGEDEIPSVPKVAKTKMGDVYKLGDHRLVCSDCTSDKVYRVLLGSAKVKITFTSPPYNLGDNAKLRGKNASGKDSAYNEKSDHKEQQDYLKFLEEFTIAVKTRSDLSFVNIQMLAGNKLIFPLYWDRFRKNVVDVMIWDKQHGAPAMAPNVLNSAFEFIFIFADRDEPTRAITTGEDFRGTIQNIYRLNPIGKKDPLAKDHGAVFPVAFPETFITNFTKPGDSVLDPFGGSGTTMIAAEKSGRKCFMIELDPLYCDVIVQRWENFTGKKAVLESKPAVQGINRLK